MDEIRTPEELLERAGHPPRAALRAAAVAGLTAPLYAEELEAATGRHLGNFPQAFTHLALINAVMHVIRDEQQPVA